jgi:hypothetical protein
VLEVLHRHVMATLRPRSTAPTRPIWLDERPYPFQHRYMTLEGHRIYRR